MVMLNVLRCGNEPGERTKKNYEMPFGFLCGIFQKQTSCSVSNNIRKRGTEKEGGKRSVCEWILNWVTNDCLRNWETSNKPVPLRLSCYPNTSKQSGPLAGAGRGGGARARWAQRGGGTPARRGGGAATKALDSRLRAAWGGTRVGTELGTFTAGGWWPCETAGSNLTPNRQETRGSAGFWASAERRLQAP